MRTGNVSRADLALPNPQGQSSVSEIRLPEVAPQDERLVGKAAPSLLQHTWLTFLKMELEFLGVTQILIGLICFTFGTTVYSVFDISNMKGENDNFSSFKTGYPFWGAVFFAISGFLSIICERKNATYLVQGRLGANTVSSIAAGIGMIILLTNLQVNWSRLKGCEQVDYDNDCFAASFSTEIVALLLFLTILEFCSTVPLIVYGVAELFKKVTIPDDRLYEELNIYSPIYSELEDKVETS